MDEAVAHPTDNFYLEHRALEYRRGAARIYESAGFELLEEEPHHSFGKDLVGQVWGRDL